MLRIDERDDQNREETVHRQAALAQIVERTVAAHTLEDESDDDNFAALKADVWGQMTSGQIGMHLEQLREHSKVLKAPKPAAKRQTVQILYYHCDHLGTPRELTDEDGKLVWSAEYEAWGKIRHLKGRLGAGAAAGAGADSGLGKHAPVDQFWHTRTQAGRANHLPEWVADTTGNLQKWREAKLEEMLESGAAANDASIWGEPTDQSIRFQGQWHDVETGLHYNRFRYYDPDCGRFVSQDPIGLLGGYNLYQYSPNPITWIDPMGLAGARSTQTGSNLPGGSENGLSTTEGGGGITNPAVQRAYDRVPVDIREQFHGKCAEADAMSKSANKAGVKTDEELKKMNKNSSSAAFRNDKKGKPMIACRSCDWVQKDQGITDEHCKEK